MLQLTTFGQVEGHIQFRLSYQDNLNELVLSRFKIGKKSDFLEKGGV